MYVCMYPYLDILQFCLSSHMFYFWGFGSSLLSIILNCFPGRLPIPSFIWSYKFLPCSFTCNIFLYHLSFADGWGCVPLLLVVWPEASSIGVCRQLGGAQVLVLRWGPLGELTSINTPWGLKFSLGLAAWTQCSHHRGSGPTCELQVLLTPLSCLHPFHLSVDRDLGSTSWLLWIVLLWTWICKYLFETCFQISCMYAEAGLLGHMVVLLFIFC